MPGLHIAEVVATQASRDRRTRVGVLGTCHTMRGPVYPRALAARGIAAEIPDEHDREALDDLIVGELVRGVLPDAPGRTASALSSAWRPGAATRSPSSAPSSRSRLRRPTRRCPCWTRPDC